MIHCKETKIKFGGQEGTFIRDFTFADSIMLVEKVVSMLVTRDEKSGIPRVDSINYLPVMLFHIIAMMTDLDTSKYENSASLYDIVDHFDECADEDSEAYGLISMMLDEIDPMYDEESERVITEIRDQNSVGAHIKSVIDALLGQEESKTMGFLRKFLTEAAISSLKGEKAKNDPAVDLSEFRVRK